MKIDESMVMALPRKLVEQIMYDPINLHLVKLVGFDFARELGQHFQRELRTWLRKIQRLRFNPSNRAGSSKFYFDLLFEYPSGGVEVRNMRLIMDEIADEESVQPVKSPEEMVAWLKAFHEELAERLHEGEDVLGLIPD